MTTKTEPLVRCPSGWKGHKGDKYWTKAGKYGQKYCCQTCGKTALGLGNARHNHWDSCPHFVAHKPPLPRDDPRPDAPTPPPSAERGGAVDVIRRFLSRFASMKCMGCEARPSGYRGEKCTACGARQSLAALSEVEEALLPFAEYADRLASDPVVDDDCTLKVAVPMNDAHRPKVSDLRRARAVLKGE